MAKQLHSIIGRAPKGRVYVFSSRGAAAIAIANETGHALHTDSGIPLIAVACSVPDLDSFQADIIAARIRIQDRS